MLSPLSRRIDRVLDPHDQGPVYTFDIDKTYLDTRFSQKRDFLRIPFELAIDKKPFPGIPELIRAAQKGSVGTGHDRPAFFLSASPAQLRVVLERRMVLDEITVDGITLKNWGYFLRKGRITALKQQVFYKLLALVTMRASLPMKCFEVLFGDDSESDAFIYSIYSAVATRTLVGHALERALETEQIEKKDRALILQASERLDDIFDPDREAHAVRHIFIHRITGRAENRVYPHGRQPIFYSHPLQPAAVLFRDGLIHGASLSRIFASMRKQNAFIAGDVADSVAETLDGVQDWRAKLEDPSGAAWP